MSKFIVLLICALMLFSMTGCSSGNDDPQESTVEIANPVHECRNIDEAMELVGFEISIPAEAEEAEEYLISVVDTVILEIQYTDADGNEICLRKAAGSEDISGDYTDYPEENSTQVGEVTVSLKGSDGNIMNATWTDGDYSYSVTASTGLSESHITEIISALS